MGNGEELCAALLQTFYLTLDAITVIDVFLCYNLLSTFLCNTKQWLPSLHQSGHALFLGVHLLPPFQNSKVLHAYLVPSSQLLADSALVQVIVVCEDHLGCFIMYVVWLVSQPPSLLTPPL